MNSNKTYRTYTGTFTKNNGHKRTMTFIKSIDVPTHIRGNSRTTTLKEGQEIVYDIDAKGFRVFNWETVQGQVTEKNINFSFDKSQPTGYNINVEKKLANKMSRWCP